MSKRDVLYTRDEQKKISKIGIDGTIPLCPMCDNPLDEFDVITEQDIEANGFRRYSINENILSPFSQENEIVLGERIREFYCTRCGDKIDGSLHEELVCILYDLVKDLI